MIMRLWLCGAIRYHMQHLKLRVTIVEDNSRYRESLESMLCLSPGFELAASFMEAQPLIDRMREDGAPDCGLVLMDLELPGLSGIEATRRLKGIWPELPVVVLTVFEDPATILEAITAGADGYLLKRASRDELLAQFRSVVDGGSPLTAGVARTILSLLRGTPGPATLLTVPLSEREQQVLKALVEGLSYKQVAASLGVSIDTVRTHIRGIYKKLQVHSAAEAVSRAIKHRLV